MKYALLVAWREYAENARTRGFWISLLLVPVIIFFSMQVPLWLEKKGTPVRYYVLVDQSETLAPVIEARLERAHQHKVFDALNEFAQKNSNAASGTNRFSSPSFEQFSTGGEAAYLEKLRPYLRPESPAFKAPRRDFQAAPLPAGLRKDSEWEAISERLRPYLRGEKKVEVDGQQVS